MGVSVIERPFSYDPLTGTRETFIFDELTHAFTIVQSVDIEPILEVNQEDRKSFRGTGAWKGDWHHVASVPMQIVQERLVKTGKMLDPAERRKFLNDPDNRIFRTRPGRV